MAKVFTVLNVGGGFLPKHAQALQKQVLQWSPPGTEFICLTNQEVPGVQTMPLKRGWPGFWAKMELFDPEIEGDFLFMDLDTVVVGPINDFLKPRPVTAFGGGGGCLMWLTEEGRREPWRLFNEDPERIMKEYGGEDVFLRAIWMNQYTVPRTFVDPPFRSVHVAAPSWQDALPGQVAFRAFRGLITRPYIFVHNGPKENVRICCFMGLPRPWDIPEFRKFYA